MIWLIGSKGMLGRAVEQKLIDCKIPYLATDLDVDITQKEKILQFIEDKKISYMINCAAYTNVDGAEKEKEQAFLINAAAVQNLAETAKKIDCVLIHISTDFVFNDHKKDPYLETDTPYPLSIYGLSKWQGEKNIIDTWDKYFIIRTAWLYGEGGKNFVYTVLRLINEKNELRIVNDQWGSPTYARDLAEFIITVIQSENSKYGIYHYTNEGEITWHTFAEKIYQLAKKEKITDKNIEVIPIMTGEYPVLAQRPKYSVLSKEKVKSIFKISIRDWQSALMEFMENQIRVQIEKNKK